MSGLNHATRVLLAVLDTIPADRVERGAAPRQRAYHRRRQTPHVGGWRVRMTDSERRHGTSKSGWCLDGHCDGCTYGPCPHDCPHPKRVAAQANTGESRYTGLGNDERPPAVTEDRSSHSDSPIRKEGVGSW